MGSFQAISSSQVDGCDKHRRLWVDTGLVSQEIFLVAFRLQFIANKIWGREGQGEGEKEGRGEEEKD